jgi:hypothetical protein
MSYLFHIEGETPSLGRLLVDLKEPRTFYIKELKGFNGPMKMLLRYGTYF